MCDKKTGLLLFIFVLYSLTSAQDVFIPSSELLYKIYPEVNDTKPDLPSPFRTENNKEYIIAYTKDNKYAIAPVTLSNTGSICPQLVVDSVDFPALARTGLHSMQELNKTRSITGRAIEEITQLGLPNGLSQAGFLAEDETVLSVIKADNQMVRNLGLTHPQLAKPLFHILNLMVMDLSLNRWNMAKHRWENIKYIFYNDCKVFVDAEDTKGGQKSIFNDQIEGAFYLKIWREISSEEQKILEAKYGGLPASEFAEFKRSISSINTGEMEPQYIMRYGFYEGHTYWRTDPISIAFIFGLKTLSEIEEKFAGKLPETLSAHFKE